MERDKKDEEHEDKLSIYRHQSINIQRKKQNVAEKMQLTKIELDEIEKIIDEKKKDLSMRTGNNDIITTVQFKRYIGELRAKTTSYKRKKAQIEEIENELKILQRTIEILNDEWKNLKLTIVSFEILSNSYWVLFGKYQIFTSNQNFAKCHLSRN